MWIQDHLQGAKTLQEQLGQEWALAHAAGMAGGASGGTKELETEGFGNNLAGAPWRWGPGENMNDSE